MAGLRGYAVVIQRTPAKEQQRLRPALPGSGVCVNPPQIPEGRNLQFDIGVQVLAGENEDVGHGGRASVAEIVLGHRRFGWAQGTNDEVPEAGVLLGERHGFKQALKAIELHAVRGSFVGLAGPEIHVGAMRHGQDYTDSAAGCAKSEPKLGRVRSDVRCGARGQIYLFSAVSGRFSIGIGAASGARSRRRRRRESPTEAKTCEQVSRRRASAARAAASSC